MITHAYDPDPKTARCLQCPQGATGRGHCLWCGHSKGQHTGTPPSEVREHLSTTIHHMGKTYVRSNVKWTPSACSVDHCACRQYER